MRESPTGFRLDLPAWMRGVLATRRTRLGWAGPRLHDECMWPPPRALIVSSGVSFAWRRMTPGWTASDARDGGLGEPPAPVLQPLCGRALMPAAPDNTCGGCGYGW